jgi:hypothetical protein
MPVGRKIMQINMPCEWTLWWYLKRSYNEYYWCMLNSYFQQPLLSTVPDTASYIRGWIQMVLAPNALFSWNNKYNKYSEYNVTDTFTSIFLAMHINLLCACRHLEAMKGSSSLSSCRLLILSRLLSSLVWAQLTLPVPALGIRSPLSQNGAPIHRVRAHSLTGIWNKYTHNH